MEYTAQEIADILNGKIEGDPNTTVSGFSKIEEGKEGTISFIANPKYSKYINTTKASIVLVNKDFNKEHANGAHLTLIRVEDAYQAFARLLTLQESNKLKKSGISKMSTIHKSATLGKNVLIDDFVYIGENAVIEDNVKILPHTYIGEGVVIGKDTVIYPGVKIYNHCKVGANCYFHAGVVLGSDGFGFAPQSNNLYHKIPQVGNVIIEDQVEIGANTCIDRATIGSTVIRRGAKLDNLIQIAHNAEVGENTVIAAQTGISGSTKIGKNCMIGGQAGFVGHITIADGVKVAAQSGITSDIKKPGQVIQGAPAFDFHKYQKSYVLFRKLPDVYNKMRELEEEIKHLKQQKE
ncbi:MAG TPA: UDP-3-O-(3-hydroxymyristoyl)glucosamine N-acyltransferase [Bacteroidales bacterium]|nr:UDP-3-O-(3-hydroxymyristoyl)glucosamine N-acyltransferase [Bacteroidales bacterium]